MVRSADELNAIEKMAAAGMRNKKITGALEVPLSTKKRGGCRGSARRRDGVALMLGNNLLRRLVCVLSSLRFSSDIGRIARDLYVCFVGLITSSGA